MLFSWSSKKYDGCLSKVRQPRRQEEDDQDEPRLAPQQAAHTTHQQAGAERLKTRRSVGVELSAHPTLKPSPRGLLREHRAC